MHIRPLAFLFFSIVLVLAGFCGDVAGAVPVENLEAFRSFVRTESWSENWREADGKVQVREVRGELWNDAIQAALLKDGTVHIPARAEPYCLDAPIILKSGQSLLADATAELRLKPGTNTCLVRNEHVVGFNDRPVPAGVEPDTDIRIEGGIWTTLANGVPGANGNLRGASAKQNPVAGTHGVILLHNVRKVTVQNVTVRQSKPFGVHLGNAQDFVVDGVRLDRHERDGVHVDGPSGNGVIRNVSGDSHDDPVALTAWDWVNYIVTYGPIHHITIEHITGVPVSQHGTDAIRLLPGVKRFADGSTLDCDIHDIVLRDITDIREFKFYDQPNLEKGRDQDASAGLGKLRNILLQRLHFTRPGVIQIAAEVDGLRVEEVNLNFTLPPTFKLVEIGPMSATYRLGKDPAHWVELFSPDLDVTVRNFHLVKVSIDGQPVADAEARFVAVKDQQLNLDYPHTSPRGGTGKAKVLP
ncbi:MAG: hypothetical protein ABJF10_02490 [Chthoniobacter sp.]|uniref:hypothetical protein n=1 Tax=Chthoniobacter sp. TaxID=2510640 RepID=UPI0032AB0F48